MKRFYKIVTQQENSQGHTILLDGKPIRTPQKNLFIIHNDHFVPPILQEWQNQGEFISPETMPLTQILMTAQDIAPCVRGSVTEELLGYIDTDLLCYHTGDDTPLGRRQKEIWGGVLKKLNQFFSWDISVTRGLVMHPQSSYIHDQLRSILEGMDIVSFTCLQILVQETGSIFLSLAFMYQLITKAEMVTAVMLEDDVKAEIYNEDFYGASPDQEKKRAAQSAFFGAADFIFKTLTPSK